MMPRDRMREPNGIVWFGVEFDPDGDQVWFRIPEEALGRMPEETSADPRRPPHRRSSSSGPHPTGRASSGINPFEVQVSEAGDACGSGNGCGEVTLDALAPPRTHAWPTPELSRSPRRLARWPDRSTTRAGRQRARRRHHRGVFPGPASPATRARPGNGADLGRQPRIEVRNLWSGFGSRRSFMVAIPVGAKVIY